MFTLRLSPGVRRFTTRRDRCANGVVLGDLFRPQGPGPDPASLWAFNAPAFGAPNQHAISVERLVQHPLIAPVLDRLRWTFDDRSSIACVLRNRPVVVYNTNTRFYHTFRRFWSRLERLIACDEEFVEAISTCYVVVDFDDRPAPAEYNDWLDAVNHVIGGPPPRPGLHYVASGVPVRLPAAPRLTFFQPILPVLTNGTVLLVNSLAHAEYVSTILCGHGLLASVFAPILPTLYVDSRIVPPGCSRVAS